MFSWQPPSGQTGLCCRQLHAQAFEFTMPPADAYDPDVHLNLSDLAVDSHTNHSVIQLAIKQSKTDPFRQGINIFLGKIIVDYITVCSPNPGPLFMLSTGAPLTRGYLVMQLQATLRKTGLNESQYNGHSFSIGAVTTAAQHGLQDSVIQTIGRWQ